MAMNEPWVNWVDEFKSSSIEENLSIVLEALSRMVRDYYHFNYSLFDEGYVLAALIARVVAARELAGLNEWPGRVYSNNILLSIHGVFMSLSDALFMGNALSITDVEAHLKSIWRNLNETHV
jgi:hypothetical protein